MTQQSNNGQHLVAKLGPRSRGLLMLVIGLGLAKWQIYDPLHAREQGLEQVTISSLLVVLAILASVLGVTTLVVGDRLERIFEDLRIDPKRLNWKNTAILLLVALIGGAIWIWIQLDLSAQGYR